MKGYIGYSTFEKLLDSPVGSMAAAIGIGVSGVILSKNTVAEVWGYAMNIPGAIKSACGHENQKWAK